MKSKITQFRGADGARALVMAAKNVFVSRSRPLARARNKERALFDPTFPSKLANHNEF